MAVACRECVNKMDKQDIYANAQARGAQIGVVWILAIPGRGSAVGR